MVGYLQSRDHFAERLRMGPDEGLLVSAYRPEIEQLPLIGWFSTIADRRFLFYRWNGELRLRIDDAPPINLRDLHADWRSSCGKARFTLKRGRKVILREVYPLSRDIELIDTDPTFVEPEDFDILLFVRNVLQDPPRMERIFRSAELGVIGQRVLTTEEEKQGCQRKGGEESNKNP
jgi:hypothetical protein